MRLFCFILLLLITGCGHNLGLDQFIVLPAHKAFIAAFDTYSIAGDTAELEQYVKSYPDTDWAMRASVLIAAKQQLEEQAENLLDCVTRQGEIEEQFVQEQSIALEKVQSLEAENAIKADELEDLLMQIEQLKDQIEQLKDQIEQLKDLLFQLEHQRT